MIQQNLYKECPVCMQAPVVLQNTDMYSCQACGLSLKEHAVLGIFKKGQYALVTLGDNNFTVAEASLKDVVLAPDPLKIALGNIYRDEQLAEISNGNADLINPVKTILAQIILEQLNEECFIYVPGLRRGHGQPLTEESGYQPTQKIPLKGIKWQDNGNLFCTTKRLVLPSNQFTFIRLDRKIARVQAFNDGIAIQRKKEGFATYFGGCYAHEAALVAAYVMAKIPALRPLV